MEVILSKTSKSMTLGKDCDHGTARERGETVTANPHTGTPESSGPVAGPETDIVTMYLLSVSRIVTSTESIRLFFGLTVPFKTYSADRTNAPPS